MVIRTFYPKAMKYINTRFVCLIILLFIVNKLHTNIAYYGFFRSLAMPDKNGLMGIYFDKADDFNNIKLTHIDKNMIFPNKYYFHGLYDDFSVIWAGLIRIPVSGSYTVGTVSDDSSWVFINEKLILDNGDEKGHPAAKKTRNIYLSKGCYTIIVKYNQYYGEAKMRFLWRLNLPGQAERTVPASVLSPVCETFWKEIKFIKNILLFKSFLVGIIIMLACYYKLQLAYNSFFFKDL